MKRLILIAGAASLLAGCASVPTAPRVTALPGSHKSYEAFERDDAFCRDRAYVAAGGNRAQQASNESAANTAAIGTLIGAAAGALIDGGHGAAVGAGMGLFTGAAIGSNQSQADGWSAQRRYDSVYLQCMYARGNQVPGRYVARRAPAYPPAGYPPPPNAAPPYGGYGAPPADAAIPPPNAPPPSWAR